MFRFGCFLIMGFPVLIAASGIPEFPPGVTISRFSLIDEGIYRGGQPNEKGFYFLKQQGVKTIINLRSKDDEGEMVKKLGMQYLHIPIRLIFPWSKIPDTAIAKYFEVVNNPDNHPIFVHCHRGADRTGALAALYRITNQGWEADKAWSEARDIGLHWWYRGLKSQVYEFDKRVDRGRACSTGTLAARSRSG
jgi:protein tyrosine/serine phosphatase